MMTLADASCYFARTPILDADTGLTLFYGQVDPYDDAKRDSATAYRRVLSVKPGTVVPAGRAIKILGSVWVLGGSELDGQAEAHRQKYVLHPAPSKLSFSRMGVYVAGTTASMVWGDMVWMKDGREIASSSKMVPTYTLYAPVGSDIREYDVIRIGTTGYLVEAPHNQASGILSATCLKLEYAPEVASLETRTYDPAQGKYTFSAITSVRCLRLRWQSLYLYGSQYEARYQEGDCTLVLPAGTVIATKDTLTLSSGAWNVVSVENLAGCVAVHGRPA